MTRRFAGLATILLLAIGGCDRASSEAPRSSNQPAWFENVAPDCGIDFTYESGHGKRHLMPEIMGGGAALFDMDSDGDLDTFLVQAAFNLDEPPRDRGTIKPSQLYRNDGNGKFTNISAGSGADVRGYGMGVATGDYDNDGYVDLYITNVGPNVMLRNEGGGRFRDVTATAAVGDPGWGTSAAFVDYDADGDLDLYVCNYLDWSPQREINCTSTFGADYCSPKAYQAPQGDVLYRNNGDGTFTDVSQAAGIRRAAGTGLGVACADFNGDGRVDIFVANDGMPNLLWINQGDGTFAESAHEMNCAIDMAGIAKAGMGVAVADIDNDRDEDLLVCNLRGETDSLYRNDGGYFSDITAQSGLAAITKPFTRFGVAFADFDNDGALDVYEANGRVMLKEQNYTSDPYAEPNLLLRGVGEKFVEVEPRGGTSELLCHTSRAAAFGDIDNDGGVDILVVNRDGPAYVLRNTVPDRGRWIMFRVLDEHGRDALGAVVSMRVGDAVIHRTVRTAYSYCAANDPRVHVGMGQAQSVNDVRVRWPDGTEESFGDFKANQIVTVRRGDGAGGRGP